MAGIESNVSMRNTISIGNGGIHAFLRVDIDGTFHYLNLGELSDVVSGVQYSYGRNYYNGSHLAKGLATLGVKMANARFVFSKLEKDVASALKALYNKKKLALFDIEEDIEFGPAIVKTSLSEKEVLDKKGQIVSYNLTNLAVPVDIVMFSTTDYCREMGIENYKDLPSLAIDNGLKYNVLVIKEIEKCVFLSYTGGLNADEGFGQTVYDAFILRDTPWKLVKNGDKVTQLTSNLTLEDVLSFAEEE